MTLSKLQRRDGRDQLSDHYVRRIIRAKMKRAGKERLEEIPQEMIQRTREALRRLRSLKYRARWK